MRNKFGSAIFDTLHTLIEKSFYFILGIAARWCIGISFLLRHQFHCEIPHFSSKFLRRKTSKSGQIDIDGYSVHFNLLFLSDCKSNNIFEDFVVVD